MMTVEKTNHVKFDVERNNWFYLKLAKKITVYKYIRAGDHMSSYKNAEKNNWKFVSNHTEIIFNYYIKK